MKSRLSRREFLKYSLMSVGALAFMPRRSVSAGYKKPRYMLVGNRDGVSVYRQPDDRSQILFQRTYSEVLTVYDEVVGPNGPIYNPIWYRVWGGYIHSGDLYEVKNELNPVQSEVRTSGQLAELTVPYTRSLFYQGNDNWKPMYKLYYGSVHWVIDIISGPDQAAWYKIKDEKNKVTLAIKAEHLRYVPDEDFAPISPDLSVGEKRIEVSKSLQTLQAYENDDLVFERKISTGNATPLGVFHIQTKMPSKHMGLGNVTDYLYAYEYVGVPWSCFFEMEEGYATHGVFWHSNFGAPMSAGCLNMKNEDAKWIYRWTTPAAAPEDWAKHGFGTKITIQK